MTDAILQPDRQDIPVLLLKFQIPYPTQVGRTNLLNDEYTEEAGEIQVQIEEQIPGDFPGPGQMGNFTEGLFFSGIADVFVS